MHPALLNFNRFVIVIVWLLVAIDVFMPFPGIWHTVLTWTGISLVIAHAIECMIFARLVKQYGQDNPAKHFLLIFIFGFFHAATLMPKSPPAQ
jgi:uncharacterized protein YhhL (DUF1145 family)